MPKYRLMFPGNDKKYYVYIKPEDLRQCWYAFHPARWRGESTKRWSIGAYSDVDLFDGHEAFVVTAPMSWCKVKRFLVEYGYNVTTLPEMPK